MSGYLEAFFGVKGRAKGEREEHDGLSASRQRLMGEGEGEGWAEPGRPLSTVRDVLAMATVPSSTLFIEGRGGLEGGEVVVEQEGGREGGREEGREGGREGGEEEDKVLSGWWI